MNPDQATGWRWRPSRTLARLARLACFAACATFVPACGGAGGFEGGIGGSGFVAGPIESLGSIVVDGIRLDISSATIIVDGTEAAEGDLAVGMVVEAQAEFDEGGESGRATDVAVRFAVIGPIGSVDDADHFSILDQPISHDETTRFVGIEAAELAEDLVVRVSGVVNTDDVVEATRIVQISPGRCSLRGRVRDLATHPDTGAPLSFRVRARDVDPTSAVVVGGPLAENDLVDVRATTCTTRGTLVAADIELRQQSNTNVEGRIQSVQGFVLDPPEGSTFRMTVIDGEQETVVRTDDETRFVGGELADLERNVRIVVRGRTGADGSLRALRIAIRNR